MNVPVNLFEEWLENKDLKMRTVENYIYYFNKFTFDSYNQESVSRFLSVKTNRNSISRGFLVNFQKFLKVNYRELNLSQEARLEISEVELPKITGRAKQRLIDPLSKEQIHLLEHHLEGEKNKLQLLLSFYCALRLGELLKIEVISFNWDVWRKDTSKYGRCKLLGKGDKAGIGHVPGVLMTRIAKYIRAQKFKSLNSRLFMKDGSDLNLKNRGRLWQMTLSKAGVKAGITKLDQEGKPIKDTVVHPHRLRHSFATYLLIEKNEELAKKGKPPLTLKHIQLILRHSDIKSTQIYTHINDDQVVDRLSA